MNMTPHPHRRADDQLSTPSLAAGLICLVIAGTIAIIVAIKGTAITWPIVIAIALFAFLAGLFMIPNSVLRAIGIWRRSRPDDFKP
jgi:membrane protein YdbS with pleckstrin-like domain